MQGRSNTKIFGGGGGGEGPWQVFKKNVAYHGWSAEKILVFEWSKMAEMALSFETFVFFSGTFLNMLRIFLIFQNKFCNLIIIQFF